MPEPAIVSQLARRARSFAPALQTLGCLLSACTALMGCGGASVVEKDSEVLHVHGDHVLDRNENSVWLRGVAFSNWTFEDAADAHPVNTYADQSDYDRVTAMGMNTVAFLFSANQFENEAAPGQYRQSGFDWLDQNIAWAKASGIRLILTLANPPGSVQWKPVCDGNRLWDVQDYRDRTSALWRALAARYANEPVIAGYDLLLTPVTSGPAEQWHDLANRWISAVREVDRHHILIIEPTYGEGCAYKSAIDAGDMFRVADSNVLYSFNASVPYAYVAQLLPASGLGDSGAYPDETMLGASLDFDATCGGVLCMQFEATSINGTPHDAILRLKPSETTWTQKAFAYTVTDSNLQIGIPIFQSDDNSGKVLFDDYVVSEYDENLNFVRTVLTVDPEDMSGLYLWQGHDDGSVCSDCPARAAIESDAHSGKASISLSGSTSLANVSNSSFAFPLKLGHTYKMSGWIKGEHSDPDGASRFRLDFWKYNANQGVLPLRNKDNLALFLSGFVNWGGAQQVPLYVDFGTGRPTFMADKGGTRWVQDMLDLAKEKGLHLAYDDYHSDDYGIYAGNGLPDSSTVNQPLVDVLTSALTP